MKHVVIGTAGHVDHGKTSLIHALTGINTDRLVEEQVRGMTIDLGFAPFKLPDGNTVSIVDVPGHERFLKNMLAGSGGVDVVLMVISAEEGIMPQTQEHLDILSLLNAQEGVVALTRCDIVEKSLADKMEQEIRTHLTGTFLEKSPIIHVSPITHLNMKALTKALHACVSRVKERNANIPFRLPIDRVFTKPGYGTVVTGTLVSGTLKLNDSVSLLPSNITARVRGLQVNNQSVKEVYAGSRVAVNLTGVEVKSIQRGDELCCPGVMHCTDRFDVQLKFREGFSQEIKENTRIRLHIGTAEVYGRIKLITSDKTSDKDELDFFQIATERSIPCMRGDRFIVRSFKEMVTFAGGEIIDPLAVKHKVDDPQVIERLQLGKQKSPQSILEQHLLSSNIFLSPNSVITSLSLTPEEFNEASEVLQNEGKIIYLGNAYILHQSQLTQLIERLTSVIESYHLKFPLRIGIGSEELRQNSAKHLDVRQFHLLLKYAEEKELIEKIGPNIKLFHFRHELNERQTEMMKRLENHYLECGIATPELSSVSDMVRAPVDAVKAILQIGVRLGKFHRVNDNVFYHDTVLSNTKVMIKEYCAAHKSISVGEYRDLTHSNRKFSLQMIEYLGSRDQQFLVRIGDRHQLVE